MNSINIEVTGMQLVPGTPGMVRVEYHIVVISPSGQTVMILSKNEGAVLLPMDTTEYTKLLEIFKSMSRAMMHQASLAPPGGDTAGDPNSLREAGGPAAAKDEAL